MFYIIMVNNFHHFLRDGVGNSFLKTLYFVIPCWPLIKETRTVPGSFICPSLYPYKFFVQLSVKPFPTTVFLSISMKTVSFPEDSVSV